MKKLLSSIFIICSGFLFAQVDTIVVNDYTKVMVSTQIEKGEVTPITSLDGLTQAGLFLHDLPLGTIKICNDGLTYVWVDGQLMRKINGCDFFNPEILYPAATSDTIFVSFTTDKAFNNFKCELVRFEKLQVIQDELILARNVRNSLNEFIIISLSTILVFFGILVGFHPTRMSFIIEKSFTFKVNAYQFINTNFNSTPSLIASALLSLILGFITVYLNSVLALSVLDKSQETIEFFISWIQLSFLIFISFFIKRLLIDLISQLFNFRELKNYQLFDFINFNLFFFILIASYIVADFVIFPTAESLMTSSILIVFPIVLIMFLIWFSLKFVNQYPHRKLIIISYLCATEIIPAVFLLGWFFK